MIGLLNGRVESVDADAALIDVGGVGYEVRMPAAELSALHAGQETRVFTSLNVSQDAVTLYGFLTQASKRMFLQLQKVSGIGPKVALSLLSTLPPDRLARAVADGDATALAKAPGLGKKGAQKIILELKGSRSRARRHLPRRRSTPVRCRWSRASCRWAGGSRTLSMPCMRSVCRSISKRPCRIWTYPVCSNWR